MIGTETIMQMKLYTTDEVAAYLRIDPAIVLTLIEGGEMRAYQVAGGYRLTEAQVLEYLSSHELPTVGQPDNTAHVARTENKPLAPTAPPGEKHGRRALHDNLWQFLNEPAVVERMIDASEHGRPAAEAIAGDLVARFDQDAKQDDVKKLTGRLIKQVMLAHGFNHHERGVRCRPNQVFSVASTYRRGA